jgi:hypothetical protein
MVVPPLVRLVRMVGQIGFASMICVPLFWIVHGISPARSGLHVSLSSTAPARLSSCSPVGSFILVIVVIATIDASCFIVGCVVFVVAIVDPCNTVVVVVVVVVFLVNDIIVITCGSFVVDSFFGNGCLVVGSFVVVVVVVVVDYSTTAVPAVALSTMTLNRQHVNV